MSMPTEWLGEHGWKTVPKTERTSDTASDPADILAGYHRTGPCSASLSGVAGASLWCKLSHGHDGDHVSEEGTRWRLTDVAARRQAAVDRVVEAARRYVLVDRAMTLDPQAVTSDMVKDINDQLERLHAAVDALEEVDHG